MHSFVHEFGDFAAALAEAEDFEDTAEQLIVYAVKALGASCGGITLLRARGHLETIRPTDPLATGIDSLQHDLKEGPCLDAATASRVVVSASVGTDGRWPRWGPAVARLGIHSVLSAEMHGRGRRMGALNLYSPMPDAFSPDDVEMATILADQTAAVMVAINSERGLREALETRTLIGQAQGMVMERFDLDAGQAFTVLQRLSQESNLRIHDVSELLVRSRKIA
jgi:GAF domain-containing protein